MASILQKAMRRAWRRTVNDFSSCAMSDPAEEPALSRTPHIALYSQCGFGNFGNDATFEVVLKHLRRHLPHARITGVVRHARPVTRQFRVPAVEFYPAARFRPHNEIAPAKLVRQGANELVRIGQAARFLSGVDYLIMAGGGRFDDFNSCATEQPYWLWKWTTLARLFGAPVELLSIGAGPVDFRLSRLFYRHVASLVTRRSFRDEESRRSF